MYADSNIIYIAYIIIGYMNDFTIHSKPLTNYQKIALNGIKVCQ